MLAVVASFLVLAHAPAPRAAVERAAAWMADYAGSEQSLNFDAAIGLALVGRLCDVPALRAAFARADARLDRDRGHPMRLFFEPDFRLPPGFSTAWSAPQGPAARVNPDRVVTEALHCREHGWRPSTTDYVCGPLRDGGGYYSAHALWALTIATENGCLEGGDRCVEDLRAEILAAQPWPFSPWSTLDVDLFAERLLMLALSGPLPAAAAGWPARLLELQNPDGSWGAPATGEPPYFRFHATMMASWALAEAAGCGGSMRHQASQAPCEAQ